MKMWIFFGNLRKLRTKKYGMIHGMSHTCYDMGNEIFTDMEGVEGRKWMRRRLFWPCQQLFSLVILAESLHTHIIHVCMYNFSLPLSRSLFSSLSIFLYLACRVFNWFNLPTRYWVYRHMQFAAATARGVKEPCVPMVSCLCVWALRTEFIPGVSKMRVFLSVEYLRV